MKQQVTEAEILEARVAIGQMCTDFLGGGATDEAYVARAVALFGLLHEAAAGIEVILGDEDKDILDKLRGDAIRQGVSAASEALRKHGAAEGS